MIMVYFQNNCCAAYYIASKTYPFLQLKKTLRSTAGNSSSQSIFHLIHLLQARTHQILQPKRNNKCSLGTRPCQQPPAQGWSQPLVQLPLPCVPQTQQLNSSRPCAAINYITPTPLSVGPCSCAAMEDLMLQQGQLFTISIGKAGWIQLTISIKEKLALQCNFTTRTMTRTLSYPR